MKIISNPKNNEGGKSKKSSEVFPAVLTDRILVECFLRL